MTLPFSRRVSATIMATLGAVMLTGCFVIPGNFDAKLDLRADGTFTYSYDGEIRLLGMTELVQMTQNRNSVTEWDPDSQICWGDDATAAAEAVAEAAEAAADAAEEPVEEIATEAAAEKATDETPSQQVMLVPADTAYEDRECTPEELEERREQFEESQKRSRERREREAKQMQAVFGGIDPSDPNAGKQISERLERQRGWNSVEYLGEGLFKVDFSITSKIEHDFAFPTMEGMGSAQPFLYAFRRDGDTVRIEAPGFARGGGNGSTNGGSMNWLMLAGMERGRSSSDPDYAELFKNTNGTFTLTTDGEILANNTDEGYSETADGRTLVWQINNANLNSAPPSALIKLSQ